MEKITEAMDKISINEKLPRNSYETIGATRTDGQSESPSPELSVDTNQTVNIGAENPGDLICRMDASTQTTESFTVPTTEISSSETGAPNVTKVDEPFYVWQFLDCRGIWIDYGNVTSLGARDSGVFQSSDKIEEEYQKGHSCFFVENRYNHYEVNFTLMIQMNTHSQRSRPIRRIKKDSRISSHGSQPWERLPHYWTEMGSRMACGPSMIIAMSSDSPEALHYTNIVKFFLPASKIKEFYRIQAPHLYRCYQIRKAFLEKLYPGVPYVENYMYHGTQCSNVDYICQENIDWRRHGTANGEQEGCGAYFTNQFNAAAVFGIQKREPPLNHPGFNRFLTPGAMAMPPSVNSSLLNLQAYPAIAAQPYLMSNANQYYMAPAIQNPQQSTESFPQQPQSINGFLNMDCSIGEKGITVIIAKVLIGRMCIGDESLTVPGYDVDGVPFDTTVNCVINPNVFVKYHIDEYYPEYCIILDN